VADKLTTKRGAQLERPELLRGPVSSGAQGGSEVPVRPGNRTLLAIGRAIFGGYFLYNGINHFVNRGMLTEYARSKGVPAADAAVPASGALLVFGGLSVVTGLQPKAGAASIATFLLGVSPQMHAFWGIEDQQTRMHEFVNFTKNMALVGAACLVAAFPEPWPVSLSLRD
jgi:uncharacterized membrane protein YphA (DoxX/SURF4 family)